MKNFRIIQLIEPYIKMQPDAPALIGADGQVLTYQQLDQAVLRLTQALSRQGVKVNQRIAAVMNTGIEMALSFFAISNVAALVPLSPDYSEDQYHYYYKILKIDYLMVPEGFDNTYCIKTAREMNIPVFYLNQFIDQDEITYDLTGGITGEYPFCLAKNEDIALVLFTSGTTSLPKIVPRSNSNIFWSAQKRKLEMGLTTKDRVLFTSPIYRGISINDTLTILASGGTVIYTEQPRPASFFHILKMTEPTWILGSPVLFHILTEYAENTNTESHCHTLQVVRSSGAPLSEELSTRLDNIFHVPIYVCYGMTETGNISSIQNSPKGFRAGSVGVPDNIEVGIMDESIELQGCNTVGEIVVRGPQVIKGYDNDDKINEESFFDEWFRTGDCGYFDDDGYLYIKGRYKEIINRGGEKVSPYEVEAAISRHPDVLQTIVFPISADSGSEDVGAALVVREGTKLYLKDLRRFLNGKIAAVKMPSCLYILKEIPASDAGKVQRKELYQTIQSLGLNPQPVKAENEELIMPQNDTEETLLKLFTQILPIKNISITDTFFELGGIHSKLQYYST